uniref:Uncharacterized protein n=1 Tax=Arundo donax TaxID=35708 RepID=A0A0A9ETB7_ARUDO
MILNVHIRFAFIEIHRLLAGISYRNMFDSLTSARGNAGVSSSFAYSGNYS